MSHIQQCSKVPCKAQTCVRYTGLAYQFQVSIDTSQKSQQMDFSLRKKAPVTNQWHSPHRRRSARICPPAWQRKVKLNYLELWYWDYIQSMVCQWFTTNTSWNSNFSLFSDLNLHLCSWKTLSNLLLQWTHYMSCCSGEKTCLRWQRVNGVGESATAVGPLPCDVGVHSQYISVSYLKSNVTPPKLDIGPWK